MSSCQICGLDDETALVPEGLVRFYWMEIVLDEHLCARCFRWAFSTCFGLRNE